MTYGLKEAHDELLSELEDLRAKYAEVCETSAMLRADMAAARERQAKLRELVRDMCKAFMHGNCYRWCEFKEPCNYITDGRCQWYDRMRELGVEV